MPATFSLSIGTSTESLRKQDINSVLLDLPDNTQKLISPKDVRDAYVTAWATSAFKQTINTSSIEYIGIDSGNPENRDIKQKIYLGKRNFAGQDVMNFSLLTNNNDTDIFIYNTKPDTSTQSITKVSILAGTNSLLHPYAPYIKSEKIQVGTSEAISLDFVNPSLYSGPINVYSTTGRISINGILFPTVTETSASASNGKILKYSGTYPNGVLRWSDTNVTVASIGSTGSPTNIYGSSSYVNGYPLEFIESSIVPKTIGGIQIGSSFSALSFYNGTSYQNWPLVEVMRKLLYPYVGPELSLSVTNTNTSTIYAEVGVTSSISFNYSLKRYSFDISNYQISGTTYSGLSYSGEVGDTLQATFSTLIYNTTVPGITQSFILSASDAPALLTFSHSATASLRFVSPFFYGFDTTNINFYSPGGGAATLRASQTGTLINTLQKEIKPYPGISQSISLTYAGSGYLYLLIPSNYALVDKVKDPNGFVIHDSSQLSVSSFTYSGVIIPTGVLNSTNYGPYRIYKTKNVCTFTSTGKFEFIF